MRVCLARAAWVERGGEWMRRLGLGFSNPVGIGAVLDVCLCLGYGGVGGVSWEYVGGGGLGPRSGGVDWCYVCVRCESGFFV